MRGDGYTILPNRLLLDQRYNALTPAARSVLTLLYAHRHADNGLAWPSQELMAKITGLGRRTVGVAVDELRKGGFVQTIRRWTGEKTQLVYTFPEPEQCAENCATPPETDAQSDAHCPPTDAQPTARCDAQPTAHCPGPMRSFTASDAQPTAHEHTKEQTKKKRSPQPPLPGIPPELDTPAFRAAWSEWESHRSHKRSKLTAEAIRRQLAKCAKIGVDRAVAMIEWSVEHGWTGLYEPDDRSGGKGDRPSTAGEGAAEARRRREREQTLGGGEVELPIVRIGRGGEAAGG